MPSAKNPQTRLIRLGQMLKIFLEREKADSTWLSAFVHKFGYVFTQPFVLVLTLPF